ncbi:hypothetical protein O6H91_01G015100 [Diphasiastrum complanatum]|uniref:Uncharacterized protein n=1 Tax=Diphasiastrum complanatum TaxID=34168 RepID=A0ACC2ENK8_DIPCM|nr:hypothetical protein O6H91_01G015100 [Diphasiastrum complanatum]
MAMIRYRSFLRMLSSSPRLSHKPITFSPLSTAIFSRFNPSALVFPALFRNIYPSACAEISSTWLGSQLSGSKCAVSLWLKAAVSTLPSQGLGTESGSEVDITRTQAQRAAGKIVLYRGRWMQPFRLIVRLKLFQLGGIAAFVIPLAEYSQQGSLSLGTLAAALAVIGGAGGASTALWYYSRRYVGELALLPPYPSCIQISVLDFWGNREDLQYDLSQITPPLKDFSSAELERFAYQAFIPLDVIGGRQFILSLRYGILLDKDLLFALLRGTLHKKCFTKS